MSGHVRARILVVDDNDATRYSTSRILQRSGFEVIEAASGSEALANVGPHVDLVVLDVNLPDFDGFEVCRRIRQHPDHARIPVVHLSATFTKPEDYAHGLESGADGYLTHPVEPIVLIGTVNAFLRTRDAEERLRHSEARFRAVFDGRAPDEPPDRLWEFATPADAASPRRIDSHVLEFHIIYGRAD